jgi:hypothetical protein
MLQHGIGYDLHRPHRPRKGDEFIHESIIGSLFRGRVEQTTTIGNLRARLGQNDGPQHHLHRRPGSLCARISGQLTSKPAYPAGIEPLV